MGDRQLVKSAVKGIRYLGRCAASYYTLCRSPVACSSDKKGGL